MKWVVALLALLSVLAVEARRDRVSYFIPIPPVLSFVQLSNYAKLLAPGCLCCVCTYMTQHRRTVTTNPTFQ
jgi:hypothetical protein